MRSFAIRNKHSGFTIVELLIVIVVIAILATISIVAYQGIQERARSAEASAGLNQAKKKLELYRVDNGSYPATGNLAAAGVIDDDVSYQYTSDGNIYCLTGTVGTTSYKVSNTGSPEQGGCAGHGQGGVAAITNLVVNPSVEGGSVGPNAPYFSAPITIDTTKSVAGTRSAKVTTNNPSLRQGMMWAVPNASSGTVYSCSVSLQGTPGKIVVVAGRVHGGGVVIGETYDAKNVTLSSSWQRVGITFTAPTNAETMYLQYRLITAESGVEIWGDAAICTVGTEQYSFADGNSPNWIWSGTPNNSTSTGPPL